MKSRIMSSLLLIFISIQFTGCVKDEKATETNENAIITNIISINEIEKIDVCVAKDFGKSTDKPLISIIDKEIIKEISQILKESTSIPGILDVSSPNYLIEIYNSNLKDTEVIYLWLGENGDKGMCMNTNNTNKVYTISISNNQKLKQIITDEKIINNYF